jgi:hypothetical protein
MVEGALLEAMEKALADVLHGLVDSNRLDDFLIPRDSTLVGRRIRNR